MNMLTFNPHLEINTFQMKLPLEVGIKIDPADPVVTFKEVMEGVNLNKYLISTSNETRGRDGYDPKVLLKIVLFAFMINVRSTRKIESLCRNDIRFMYLSDEVKPTHMTIANFINNYLLDSIEQISNDITKYIINKQNIDISTVFIDGTKIEAFPNKYTCQLTRLYDNMDIPLKALPSGAEGNIAYCQVTSFDPYLVIIPGYHYELVLSIIGETNSFDNILSFNIFTSSTNTANRQIFDKGTFPNVFIIKKASSSNNRITLTPKETTLIRNINLSFDFTIQFTFSEWFSWKDYVICVRFPKKVIDIEGSVSASLSPVTGTSTTLPLGTFSALEMEQDSLRRTVGFIFSDDTHSYKDHSYYNKSKEQIQ